MASHQTRCFKIAADGFGFPRLADLATCKTIGSFQYPVCRAALCSRWPKARQDTYGLLVSSPGSFTCTRDACCNRSPGLDSDIKTLPKSSLPILRSVGSG